MAGVHAVFGWLILLIKFALTLGGIVAVVVGLFTGSWTLVVMGVVAVLLGQVVHAVDQRLLDLQFENWATEALDSGPTPPREVRTQLMKSVAAQVGYRGDLKFEFQMACREWASEQERALHGADLKGSS